jgi:UDP-glucose 4-epimerase
MRVLVVGGAGYIGGFASLVLVQRGHEVVVFDNLSTGHREALPQDATFVEGDLEDLPSLNGVLHRYKFDAVMHFSAKALVGESVQAPLSYYRNNVSCTTNLLQAMAQAAVHHFIFSSTAAVFGIPESTPIQEVHPTSPINPYGHSKAMVERILDDVSKATHLRFVSLRYFNAAGAATDGSLGEDHRPETHLIPLVIRAALHPEEGVVNIFGTDYPTRDGTCVRDYIHVLDLAEAHILALEYLLDGGESCCFNLGNGRGFSVKEVIQAAEEVMDASVPVVEAPRRPGDPPVLVASSERIRNVLGWSPQYPSIHQIIGTALRWHASHPNGYGG